MLEENDDFEFFNNFVSRNEQNYNHFSNENVMNFLFASQDNHKQKNKLSTIAEQKVAQEKNSQSCITMYQNNEAPQAIGSQQFKNQEQSSKIYQNSIITNQEVYQKKDQQINNEENFYNKEKADQLNKEQIYYFNDNKNDEIYQKQEKILKANNQLNNEEIHFIKDQELKKNNDEVYQIKEKCEKPINEEIHFIKEQDLKKNNDETYQKKEGDKPNNSEIFNFNQQERAQINSSNDQLIQKFNLQKEENKKRTEYDNAFIKAFKLKECGKIPFKIGKRNETDQEMKQQVTCKIQNQMQQENNLSHANNYLSNKEYNKKYELKFQQLKVKPLLQVKKFNFQLNQRESINEPLLKQIPNQLNVQQKHEHVQQQTSTHIENVTLRYATLKNECIQSKFQKNHEQQFLKNYNSLLLIVNSVSEILENYSKFQSNLAFNEKTLDKMIFNNSQLISTNLNFQ